MFRRKRPGPQTVERAVKQYETETPEAAQRIMRAQLAGVCDQLSTMNTYLLNIQQMILDDRATNAEPPGPVDGSQCTCLRADGYCILNDRRLPTPVDVEPTR